MGRGDVIITRTVQVPNSKSFNFRFLASFAMVPKASLIVYYIRDDGEIISDRLKISFGDELQNFVSLFYVLESLKSSRIPLITRSILSFHLKKESLESK